MLEKCVISNNIVTVLKERGKPAPADVNRYCKITSLMALEGVMLFLRLKMLHTHVNMRHSQLLVGFPQCNGGKLGEAEDFKCVFVIYCVLESK